MYKRLEMSHSRIIPLDSVGSGIDPRTGITYPAYQDGGYDFDAGVHVLDTTGEWRDALSERDYDTYFRIAQLHIYKHGK